MVVSVTYACSYSMIWDDAVWVVYLKTLFQQRKQNNIYLGGLQAIYGCATLLTAFLIGETDNNSGGTQNEGRSCRDVNFFRLRVVASCLCVATAILHAGITFWLGTNSDVGKPKSQYAWWRFPFDHESNNELILMVLFGGIMCLWGIANGMFLNKGTCSFCREDDDSATRASLQSNYPIHILLFCAMGPLLTIAVFWLTGDDWSMSTLEMIIYIGLAMAVVNATFLIFWNEKSDQPVIGEEEEHPINNHSGRNNSTATSNDNNDDAGSRDHSESSSSSIVAVHHSESDDDDSSDDQTNKSATLFIPTDSGTTTLTLSDEKQWRGTERNKRLGHKSMSPSWLSPRSHSELEVAAVNRTLSPLMLSPRNFPELEVGLDNNENDVSPLRLSSPRRESKLAVVLGNKSVTPSSLSSRSHSKLQVDAGNKNVSSLPLSPRNHSKRQVAAGNKNVSSLSLSPRSHSNLQVAAGNKNVSSSLLSPRSHSKVQATADHQHQYRQADQHQRDLLYNFLLGKGEHKWPNLKDALSELLPDEGEDEGDDNFDDLVVVESQDTMEFQRSLLPAPQKQMQSRGSSPNNLDNELQIEPIQPYSMIPSYLVSASSFLSNWASGLTMIFVPVYLKENCAMSPIQVQLMYVGLPICEAIVIFLAAKFVSTSVGSTSSSSFGRRSTVLILATSLVLYMASVGSLYAMAYVGDTLPQHVLLFLPLVLYTLHNSFVCGVAYLQKSLLVILHEHRQTQQFPRVDWVSPRSVLQDFSWSGAAIVGGIVCDMWGYQRAFYATCCLDLLSMFFLACLWPLLHH
ncbi:hypothetical protein ACA910_014515 [Epithemia clementina (nom. ined.)]